jgi:WD40 repeat protein
MHPDGNLMAVCSRSLSVIGPQGVQFTIGEGLRRAAAFSPDGRYLVFASSDPGSQHGNTSVIAWDLVGDQARVLRSFPSGSHQTRIEFSPSGNRLGVTGHRIHLLDWRRVVAKWSNLPASNLALPVRYAHVPRAGEAH